MWSYLPIMAVLSTAWGHGRVLEPPSRASAWRAGFSTPPDYDDDGVNCGGFAMQWSVNGGKCGICGDAYNIPPPRPHELGGAFGQGVIVAHYSTGAYMDVIVDLTASHKGFWEFKLCPDPEDNEQECFDRHLLPLDNGDTKYYPTRGSNKYELRYKLPEGLVCEHCVIQWRYTAGNNWGICSNGTQGLGCGNQEQFGACSDISIGLPREYGVNRLNTKDKEYNAKENDISNNYEIPYPLFYYLKYGFFDVQKGLANNLNKKKVKAQAQYETEAKKANFSETKDRTRPKKPRKKGHKPKTRIKTRTKFKGTFKRGKNKRKNKKKKYFKRNKKVPHWG